MKVKVKLFASLREYGADVQVLDLPDRTTIDQVVDILRLPRTTVALKVVDGEHRPLDYELRDGNELALFPLLAGG